VDGRYGIILNRFNPDFAFIFAGIVQLIRLVELEASSAP
jgi:hypothetical protein